MNLLNEEDLLETIHVDGIRVFVKEKIFGSQGGMPNEMDA